MGVFENISVEVSMRRCCVSVGHSSDQNPRFRRTMEDAHVVVEEFGGDKQRGFFGVYDGHGGGDAANHASESLHKHFLNELLARPDARFPELIARAYVTTDKELKDLGIDQQGSTAVTCYVAPPIPLSNPPSSYDGQLVLHTANAGDARAVLCRGGRAIRLSYDHKAGDAAEAQRIAECGGFIVYGRVNAVLSVTRSLGDHSMKQCVLSYPHTSEVKLRDEDEFVIVACDGLWDVLSDQDAVEFARDFTDAEKMSKALVAKALEAGTTDNVTVVCVRFN
eukprot:c4891_g1_i1.p1 GENE.c4891_g1_i1~~c4891_g1_i1.p1  ORF type:complete len:279 (-),score=68.93 c4891_g1_i1:69-905(-)